MKEFGLQIYSVRDYFTTVESTKETFLKLREFGYSYVQTAGTYDYISAEEFRRYADEAGITVCGTHYSWTKISEDVEGTIAYHRTLGTKYIGIGGMPSTCYETMDNLLAFLDRFNEMAAIYAKEGFVLTYHNHSMEFTKLEGKRIFDVMAEKLDPKNTSFVLDVYWAHAAGMDVRALLEELKGRVCMIHLKDGQACVKFILENGKSLRTLERIEVGEGNINFPAIIRTAEACGVEYFVVEDEIYSTGDSMDSVRLSASNIQKKFLS